MSRTAFERRAWDIAWKKGDTAPAVAEQLLDGNGVPVVLSGASVKFLLWIVGEAAVHVSATATITDAALGKVSYTPTSTATDTVGIGLIEWQVTYSGGLIQTFLGSTYQKVQIEGDLGA